MTVAYRNLGLILICLALLSACGSPGVPLPPSLELARPVTDLRAARKGSTVTLTWTAPTRTTDGHNIRHAGPTEICRATETVKQCGAPLAKLAPQKNLNEKQTLFQTYTDALTNFSSTANAKFVYAVEIRNSYGKTAGLSNEVEVPAVPTLPAPQNLQAQLAADGVHLSWTPAANVPEIPGLHFAYRIYRREATSNTQAIAGELPVQAETAPTFLDNGIEWEKTYQYHLTVVSLIAQAQGSEQQVEGDDSPEITVVVHDVFPPATPTGLQAVFGGPGQKPFIDLIWAPDTDADLAGYNVYRSESGVEPKKLNADPVKSPAFRDDAVLPGHAYFYSVSAIDIRGNESPRSEPAEEKVPEQ
jgi:fibronectin type 3 domain-containing protein